MTRIDSKSIGKRVAALRKNLGMTAEDLAAELSTEITSNALAKLENGHRAQISPDLLLDLSKALGVSPLLLLVPLERLDSEIIIGSKMTSPREAGMWLMGLSPEDQITETFRHVLLCQRRIVTLTKQLASAGNDVKPEIQNALTNEISLKDLLEEKLANTMRLMKLDRDG